MSTRAVEVVPLLQTQVAGQILLALVLAAILGFFYRLYRRLYLRDWALGWAALAVYLTASLVARVEPVERGIALGLLAGVASLVPGYLHIGWLLLGTRGLAFPGEVPPPWRRGLLLAAVAAGVASSIVLASGPSSPWAISLRSGVAAVAYVTAALLIVRRARPQSGVGPRFATLALLGYAADQLSYFVLGFATRSEQIGRLPFLVSFDLVAQAVLGLALVTWLIENERSDLVQAVETTRRKERAQECLYRISEAARTVWDLQGLFRSIHESVGGVLPARNFYIALFEPESETLSFPYFVDERDTTPSPKPLGRGLTEYVLRTRRPLLATPEVFQDLVAQREVELIASDSVDWLGAPLVAGGDAIGVVAVQTYDPALRLGPEDRDLLMFVAEQIATAIESKRAEEALRGSEARLQIAIEQAPAILWTTDRDLRFTSSVGAALGGLGLRPNQVVGMTLEQFLGSSSPALTHHRRALQGQSAGFEYEMEGRAYTVHVEPLRDARGEIQGAIGLGLDVTEARRADRALRESESRLRQVIDLVPHFIFAKNEEGQFLLVNRAVADAYGTTVEQLIGRTDADFAPSAEEARRFREDDLEVIRSGEPRLVLEEPITDARGRKRYLQTTKIPFAFSGTGRRAVLGVAIDITERKATEEALRRAAKEESLSVLAGGVAHDFNNLLAAILGHASLALARLPEGSAVRRHVEKAAHAVERASELTRQMLAYSGRGHFVVRPTDLDQLVRENLPLLEVALPKKVRLEADLGGDLPAVDADVGQLQQVLMNLVINAAEAIGDRGGTVRVSTGTRRVGAGDSYLWAVSGHPLAPGSYVSLAVQDDGPGMDARTVDRIFEPFFTTKFTGRGLGLAAVLGVVRGHRGALSVESTPGEGSVFRLLLAPSASKAARRAEESPTGVGGPRTLLLIDDEDVVRDMVAEVLEQSGVEVLSAGDGYGGLALYRERRHDVDVVLLDLSMPGLSGEETFARLRDLDPEVRVILSSGYDREEATRRFHGQQPAGFIQKPYRPHQLIAEIERCLGYPTT
jgi:two-component system cell cycle sensor histidine kinase/response regulator CckA